MGEMNSVEASPLRAPTAPPGPASEAIAPRAGKGGPAPSAPDAGPAPAPSAAAPPPAPLAAPPSLAALLSQARLAQAQLAAQPLPIANHSGDFILKLLGG